MVFVVVFVFDFDFDFDFAFRTLAERLEVQKRELFISVSCKRKCMFRRCEGFRKK